MTLKKIYMQYICKYCDKIYLDKDVKGRMTPIKGCYCPECVEKYGFVNPETLPKKKLSKKQISTLQKNQFRVRKNGQNSEQTSANNMEGGNNEH